MADRVRVVVWESTSKGGSSDDTYQKEIDPNEDGVDARALFLQNDSTNDSVVIISRDSSGNMTFEDDNTGPHTLTALTSGGFDVDSILVDDVTKEVLVDDNTNNVLVNS